MDHGAEVRGLCIARATDIELFLHEIFRLERHLTLRIADADHATGKGHLVDGHLIGRHTAHRLDHHIGTEAAGQFLQTGMHILLKRVHGIGGSHLLGQRQFLVVDVGSDDGSTTQGGTHHGAHAHHTTANHHHHVDIRHLGTVHGMETDTHRLYQCTGAGIESLGGNHLLPGQDEQFAHGTPALHAERLVVLAGVHTAIPARGALATIGIGIHGDNHAGLQHIGHVLAHADNLCAHLMTGHHGHLHHRVAAAEGVQVAPAEAHVSHLQQYLAVAHLRLGHLNHLHHRRLTNLNCFHIFSLDNTPSLLTPSLL